MELNKIVKRKNKIVRAGTDFFIGSFTLMCMIIATNIISERNIEAKRLISSNQIPTINAIESNNLTIPVK